MAEQQALLERLIEAAAPSDSGNITHRHTHTHTYTCSLIPFQIRCRILVQMNKYVLSVCHPSDLLFFSGRKIKFVRAEPLKFDICSFFSVTNRQKLTRLWWK